MALNNQSKGLQLSNPPLQKLARITNVALMHLLPAGERGEKF